MKQLTENEIRRTAHKYIEKWYSDFGFTSDRDKNQMCISCKNEGTEIIRDPAYLVKFDEVYGDVKYVAVHCPCCGAVFSYYK